MQQNPTKKDLDLSGVRTLYSANHQARLPSFFPAPSGGRNLHGSTTSTPRLIPFSRFIVLLLILLFTSNPDVKSWDRESEGGATLAESQVDVQIYQFRLKPTTRARAATGVGELFIAWSPFGISVTADGFLDYELLVTIKGLPPVSTLGGKVYVAWITTPELDRIEKLGIVGESGKLKARVATMNKFIFLVTAETSPEVKKRSGPVVMRGISPSGLLQNYDSHELFNNMPH